MSHVAVAEAYNSQHVWCVVVHAKCDTCQRTFRFDIPETEWLAWTSGELIHRAITSLPDAEREVLISGTCGPCFDKLFEGDVR